MKVRHLGTGNGALLADGRVLLTGGGLPGIAETEIYDPVSRTVTRTRFDCLSTSSTH